MATVLRSLFFSVVVLCAGTFVRAQNAYKVFPWKSEQTVYTHFLQRIHTQYDLRTARLNEALQSVRSMTAYRDAVRRHYVSLLGEMPQRTDLRPRIVDTIRKEGYRIEKVVFESVPNYHVTANLYIPDGTGPFPAVLFLCGHEREAKATDSYQRTAALFAINGFVVLVIDPVSQGERFQLTDHHGQPRTRGGTTEHTLINAAANLAGTGVVAFQLWDNVRSIDYLLTRTEVDANRIGCVGNSGGATQLTYLVSFDDRIKVAAPASYVTRRRKNFDLVGANDGCQHLVGEGGIEINDYLILFAPKPLLIVAGRYDFVDYNGTVESFNELLDVYQRFGSPGHIGLFTGEDGHGLSKKKREALVEWFKRWFYDDTTKVTEPRIGICTEKELQCTPVGQVTSLEEEVTLTRRIQSLISPLIRAEGQSVSAVRSFLPVNVAPVLAEQVGIVKGTAADWVKVILRREGEIPVAALMVIPPDKVKRVAVWVHAGGKHKVADSVALIEQGLKNGTAFLIADVAGFGEMADLPAANDPKYANREYRTAMAALHAGTSLPVGRAANILSLIDFVVSDYHGVDAPIHLCVTGAAVLPALLAAVVDDRIHRVEITGGVTTFQEIVNDPCIADAYSHVIPGILQVTGIQGLLSGLGGRVVMSGE